jgi:hypothetical protein
MVKHILFSLRILPSAVAESFVFGCTASVDVYLYRSSAQLQENACKFFWTSLTFNMGTVFHTDSIPAYAICSLVVKLSLVCKYMKYMKYGYEMVISK